MFSKVGVPGTSGKEPASQCRRRKRRRFDHCVGKIPWRMAWQPTPVFLPGESDGQRSLEGYGPQSRRESDMTKVTEHVCTHVWHWSFPTSPSIIFLEQLLQLFPRPPVPPGFMSSLPPEPLPHHISYPPTPTQGPPPLRSISALPMWLWQDSDCTLVVDVIRVIYLLKISSMKTESVVRTSCTFCCGSHTASSMPRMFTKCLLNESWFLRPAVKCP